MDKQTRKNRRTISDLGRKFLADVPMNYYQKENIKKTTITAYNPTCNGIVERVYAILGNLLRMYKN